MDKFNDYINQNVASTKGLEANWVYHTMTVSDVTDMMDIMIVATEILDINMLILRCCKFISSPGRQSPFSIFVRILGSASFNFISYSSFKNTRK